MGYKKRNGKGRKFFLSTLFWSFLILNMLVFSALSVYSAEPIKVGGLFVLSGVTGSAGELQVKSAKSAAEVIKDQGGIINGQNFEFKILDNEGKADVVVRQIKRLVNTEGYKFVLVGGNTATCAAVQNIAHELDAVIIDVVAMSNFLRGKDCKKNVFLAAAPVNVTLRALAKRIVKDKFTGLRWAGLDPDYSFGHDSWESFSKYIKEYDPSAQLIGPRYFPFREPNLVPHIEGVIASKPTGIFSSAWAGDLHNIINQGAPRGLFKEAILATYDILEALRIGGGKHVPKTTIVSDRECWAVNPDSPQSRKIYQEKYWKMYGERPIYQQSCSYDGVIILAEAIRKAKSMDVSKVIGAIEGLEYSGSLGKSVVRAGDRQVEYPYQPTYRLIAAPGEPKPSWLKVPEGGWKMVDPYGITGNYDPPGFFGCPFAGKK